MHKRAPSAAGAASLAGVSAKASIQEDDEELSRVAGASPHEEIDEPAEFLPARGEIADTQFELLAQPGRVDRISVVVSRKFPESDRDSGGPGVAASGVAERHSSHWSPPLGR